MKFIDYFAPGYWVTAYNVLRRNYNKLSVERYTADHSVYTNSMLFNKCDTTFIFTCSKYEDVDLNLVRLSVTSNPQNDTDVVQFNPPFAICQCKIVLTAAINLLVVVTSMSGDAYLIEYRKHSTTGKWYLVNPTSPFTPLGITYTVSHDLNSHTFTLPHFYHPTDKTIRIASVIMSPIVDCNNTFDGKATDFRVVKCVSFIESPGSVAHAEEFRKISTDDYCAIPMRTVSYAANEVLCKMSWGAPDINLFKEESIAPVEAGEVLVPKE